MIALRVLLLGLATVATAVALAAGITLHLTLTWASVWVAVAAIITDEILERRRGR